MVLYGSLPFVTGLKRGIRGQETRKEAAVRIQVLEGNILA